MNVSHFNPEVLQIRTTITKCFLDYRNLHSEIPEYIRWQIRMCRIEETRR
jgi:hypothetical protein